MKYDEVNTIWENKRYKFPLSIDELGIPNVINNFEAVTQTNKTTHNKCYEVDYLDKQQGTWTENITVDRGSWQYMSFFAYVPTGNARFRIGVRSTTETSMMLLRYEVDNTIDLEIWLDGSQLLQQNITSKPSDTWTHWIIGFKTATGGTRMDYVVYKDGVIVKQSFTGTPYTNGLTLNGWIDSTTNGYDELFYYDSFHLNISLADALAQLDTISLYDGDLAGNVFLDTAGYFRNFGSPDIEPAGIGIQSVETDKGAITVASQTEDDIIDNIEYFRKAVETETNTGAMWRVVEERKLKYFNPLYQKTIIIERKRLI